MFAFERSVSVLANGDPPPPYRKCVRGPLPSPGRVTGTKDEHIPSHETKRYTTRE